jgi:hypothetical protein
MFGQAAVALCVKEPIADILRQGGRVRERASVRLQMRSACHQLAGPRIPSSDPQT